MISQQERKVKIEKNVNKTFLQAKNELHIFFYWLAYAENTIKLLNE